MTTFLIILTIWLAGWAYGSRLALQHRMTRLTCSSGRWLTLEYCLKNDPKGCARPEGEIRDRTLTDGAAALGIGMAWPVLVLARIIVGTTPLTTGEQDRTIREQKRRIDQQARQIADAHRQLGIRDRRDR
jgi:hypothetical protein